jgi:hypothetical protein
MKKLSIQYLAGLMDGEGTITLSYESKGDKWRSPVLSVSSTTAELVDALKSTYGGCICKHKKSQQHHKQAYSWRCPRGLVAELCDSLKDLLVVPEKQHRASLIASSYRQCTPRNGKYTSEQAQLKTMFEYNFFHPSKP